MKISQSQNKKTCLRGLIGNKVVATLLVYNLFLLATGLVIIGLVQPSLFQQISQSVERAKTIAINYLSSQTVAAPKHFKIDIKHKDYQKIAYHRKISLESTLMVEVPDSEVPADITYQDKKYKAKLRLKGKVSDHWKEEATMSLKIKVKNGKSILGMRNFAFQHPRTRNYLNEWFFQKLAKEFDIINLRYDFVSVDINGKGANIYALEEGLDKLLIENNKRKEGVILEFNVDPYWNIAADLLKANAGDVNQHKIMTEIFSGAGIDGFQKKKIIESPVLSQQFIKARNLLEQFRRGELPVAAVFDIEKMAALYAIVNLFGNDHACGLGNIRFYFNPITSRLEPIARDQTVLIQLRGMSGEEFHIGDKDHFEFNRYLFADKGFFAAYLQNLEKISDINFLDTFFQKIDPEMKENLSIIHQTNPKYSFPKELIYLNQNTIATNLKPKEKIITFLNYIDKQKKKIGVSIKNVSTFPLEILSLTIQDSITIKSTSGEYFPFIQASKRAENSEQMILEFELPEALINNDSFFDKLNINYRFLKNKAIASSSVYPWPNLSDYPNNHDLMHVSANWKEFPFLLTDEAKKIIYFKAGDFQLTKNLILPAGFTIKSKGSFTIDIRNQANIISLSPFQLSGTEQKPIQFFSTDSTGQGIVIMKAKKRSSIKYVVFDNLANPAQDDWTLTGAITFYYSPVEITNCHFNSNRIGDDFLNLVHSTYTMEYSKFKQTNADALDTDFSNGSIKDCEFDQIGNDGIDVSGSKVFIENLYLNQVGDKGISAGENSNITVKNAAIKNSELAVTSKDNSIINIEKVTMENSRVGFTVFQKKPEFGPGQINATDITLTEVEFPYLVERNSTLHIDRKRITPNRKNVEAALYGNEFGKSSKR